MDFYNHLKIDKKWQKNWQEGEIYKTSNTSKKKKMYVLDMFPYPSGAGLHVGHPRGYIGSDVYARMKRMEGYNVLHPMGYDAFGLPAEQYALEHKIHPRKAVEENIKTFERQLSIIGLSYDWSRKVNTTDPKYYKWTQWIFLELYNSWFDISKNKARKIDELIKIFEKGGNSKVNAFCSSDVISFEAKDWINFSKKEKQDILMKYRLAYEGYSEVNWCPNLGTVLANDEIVNDKDGNPISERGSFPVVKKSMRQWFLRITAYADRLLDGLSDLSWSDHLKEIQKNWIGKSEGSEIEFKIKNSTEKLKVFTTRADTLFGVTYVVVAGEHDLISKIKTNIENWEEVETYIKSLKNKSDIDRVAENKEKSGICLRGIFAINPANEEEVPVWIGDYVLASYGTGAVMAVPAHDERDYDFAKKYNLPIREVVLGGDITKEAFTDYGVLVNSSKFNGMPSIQARKEITDFVSGKVVCKYKIRDAIFARQRYWGEPIPLTHNSDGTINDLKLKDLPLELPKVKSYEISGSGESPLSLIKSWTSKGYETNTMPGWAGSSWYFLRYMDPNNDKNFASKKALSYWKDVDMYIGGQEHATGHLLYSRFWNNFLFDLGYVPKKEPFKKLINQGMILASDGRKMSKRWGNVINPDEIVKNYGADTLRVYEMFMGPFDQSLPWSTESIIGSRRFIERVSKLYNKISNKKSELSLEKILHKTIKRVTDDIESFNFNTAISGMMIFINEAEKFDYINDKDFEMFLQILAPFAPHITEELWSNMGNKKSIHISAWPKYDKKLIIDDEIKIAVQVNGKVRAEIIIKKDANESFVKDMVLKNKVILGWLGGKDIKKFIYVPNRVINIVV